MLKKEVSKGSKAKLEHRNEDSRTSEEKKKAIATVLESLARARLLLKDISKDEEKMRDVNLLWQVYSDVEFAIGLGKYIVKDEEKLGVFKDLPVLKKNDPSIMPVIDLSRTINTIDSELEYSEYDLETNPSKNALKSAREARDELKLLILGNRKSSRQNSSGRTKTKKNKRTNPK